MNLLQAFVGQHRIETAGAALPYVPLLPSGQAEIVRHRLEHVSSSALAEAVPGLEPGSSKATLLR